MMRLEAYGILCDGVESYSKKFDEFADALCQELLAAIATLRLDRKNFTDPDDLTYSPTQRTTRVTINGIPMLRVERYDSLSAGVWVSFIAQQRRNAWRENQ